MPSLLTFSYLVLDILASHVQILRLQHLLRSLYTHTRSLSLSLARQANCPQLWTLRRNNVPLTSILPLYPPAMNEVTMASQQPPAETSTSASATPSNAPYDEPSRSTPKHPAVGNLRVQTDFGDAGNNMEAEGEGYADYDGDHSGYESEQDFRPKETSRARSLPEYTIAEEREVVKKLDRKLVPFLALCYLLSFLDRSSTFTGMALMAGDKLMMN